MGTETTARRQGEEAGGPVGLASGFVCGALVVFVLLLAAAGLVLPAFILADTFFNAY
jgi:hypothetical protein